MKKLMLSAVIASSMLLAVSCSKDDDNGPGGDTGGLVELRGDLSTQTLTKDKKYLVVGQVFVRNGQTLTIEPGTVIFGDKRTRGVLVVDRGGKMIAEGTAAEPIVMTSNQEAGVRDRGDWGGLVILGNAPTNQPEPAIEGITPEVIFGGTNDNDNSGVYKYLRVEFAGIELTPNNETNSITMGGVGRGTLMEYCMVSFGGDDGFEWFGGNVDGKYFISFNSWDDCWDVDFAYSGRVQFGLSVRYPSYADQSGSNSFECDNGPNDNDVQPYTTGVFSNFTCIGPIKTGDRISNGNFQHNLDLRRRTAVTIANSVFTGFPRGMRMNQPSVLDQYTTLGNGLLHNNIMVGTANSSLFLGGSGVNPSDVEAYWRANNQVIDGPNSDAITTSLGLSPDIFYGNNLANNYPGAGKFTVTGGTLASGADFTPAKLNDSYFDKVQFRGAFGATDWTAGWAEFDPVDRNY
jgi:hypothetical protein